MPKNPPPVRLTRRHVMAIGASFCAGALAGCRDTQFHAMDISGASPPLAFTMTRARDAKAVSEADYRGKVTLLYFGYTFCPDICPLTLSNVADVLRRLGPQADAVRVLFATVDPARDTLPVLADYEKSFAPQIDALRGTPDQLAALARRYRIAYSAEPATKDRPYQVTHGSVVYVFDGTGAARLLIASLAAAHPDIAGTAEDLRRLIAEARPQTSIISRLRQLV
jgi:protein SCO1/2